MPNPLTAAMSAPTTHAKGNQNTQEQPEQKEAGSFQSVLDEQTETTTDDAETPDVPTPEAEAAQHELPISDEPTDAEPLPTDRPTSLANGNHEVQPDRAILVFENALAPEKLAVTGETAAAIIVKPDKPIQQSGRVASDLPHVSPTKTPVPVAPDVNRAVNSTSLAQATQTSKPPAPVLSENAADPNLVEPVQDAPAAQPRTPINTATSLVQMQIMATEKNPVVPDVSATPELDEISAFKDVSPTSSARDTLAAAQALTASARAETARAVAGQMAAAIHARPQSGMIEIALNPEELGRVSIVMNGRDDGLHLTIATERPETLDMIRRHISLLEAEFKSLGLGDLSFDLGTSSDTGSDEQNDAHTAASEPEHATQAQPDPSARPIIGTPGRIDIRL